MVQGATAINLKGTVCCSTGSAVSIDPLPAARTGYFLWTLFFRDRRSVMNHVVRRRGKCGVFLKDLGQAAAMYWILIQVWCSSAHISLAAVLNPSACKP